MAGSYPINGIKVRARPEDSAHSTVYAPQAGAVVAIPVVIRGGAIGTTNTNTDTKITLPTGMVFKLSSIQVAALGTITSDPALTIGTAAGGTQVVASVNITSNLGSLTLKATTLSGDTYIRIANDTGDSIAGTSPHVTVTLVGYWQSMPSALYLRNSAHF